MVSTRLVILPADVRANGECSVMIQITQNRKSARIKTDISVSPDDFLNGKVLDSDPNWKLKNIILKEKVAALERVILHNEEKFLHMDVKAIKQFLEKGHDNVVTDFIKFTELRLTELKADGNIGTYNPLRNMLKLVRGYHGRNALNFSEITPRFLEGFTAYYRKKDHKINSIAVYMRYIRSMFNDAIDEYNNDAKSPVILNYPFRKFKIKTEATKNRNLHIEIIRSIRDLKTSTKREEITKDVFMLQIYMDGINIKDLFYLRHTYFNNGRLEYNRFKTTRYNNLKIEPETKAIFDKYRGEKYLLWFADNCKEERTGTDTRKAHARIKDLGWLDSSSFNKMLNETLQTIQERLKIILQGNLTTYYARHSLASLMREIGISKDDISLCMGHKAVEKNLKTTGGYIAEDFKSVDIANRELIDFINSTFEDGESWKKNKEQPKSVKNRKKLSK